MYFNHVARGRETEFKQRADILKKHKHSCKLTFFFLKDLFWNIFFF